MSLAMTKPVRGLHMEVWDFVGGSMWDKVDDGELRLCNYGGKKAIEVTFGCYKFRLDLTPEVKEALHRYTATPRIETGEDGNIGVSFGNAD